MQRKVADQVDLDTNFSPRTRGQQAVNASLSALAWMRVSWRSEATKTSTSLAPPVAAIWAGGARLSHPDRHAFLMPFVAQHAAVNLYLNDGLS
jgi:hypothetical protein